MTVTAFRKQLKTRLQDSTTEQISVSWCSIGGSGSGPRAAGVGITHHDVSQ